MNDRIDDELRERFAVLRREERATVPAFRSTLAAARSRKRPRRMLVIAAAATVGVVALALILTLGSRRRTVVDLASVRVHAPTDFLLQVPGAELLRVVPRRGRVSFDRMTL